MRGVRSKSKSQSGQAILEYILLLSILIMSVSYIINYLRDKSDLVTAVSGAKIEKLLRTGSAPANIWTK